MGERLEVFEGLILVGIAVLVMAGLLQKRVRESALWQATATPLASIIGSGFLIVAPLLGVTVGAWAPVAMLGIVLLATAIGSVMRFQITHTEPLLDQDAAPRWITTLESLSGAALSLGYVVSVAFYVRLLSAFSLHMFHLEASDWAEKLLTTVVLLSIGGWGFARGLKALESLEDTAVSVKLGIIAALLVALLVYDSSGAVANTLVLPSWQIDDPVQAMRTLAGLLLVVQGFETSRYLGDAYDAETRVKTMWWAQLSSGIVYVLFVGLCLPLLSGSAMAGDETAIIGLTERVHRWLPFLLVIAALMSQFSAAVADTLGGGGLIAELSGGRVPPRYGYAGVVGFAVVLTWSADIFQVISFASQAFAVYYGLQSVSACAVAWRLRDVPRAIGFGLLASVLALVTVFAIPAG